MGPPQVPGHPPGTYPTSYAPAPAYPPAAPPYGAVPPPPRRPATAAPLVLQAAGSAAILIGGLWLLVNGLHDGVDTTVFGFVIVVSIFLGIVPLARAGGRSTSPPVPGVRYASGPSQAATLSISMACLLFFVVLLGRTLMAPPSGPADVAGQVLLVVVLIDVGVVLLPGVLLLLSWRNDIRGRVSVGFEAVASVLLLFTQLLCTGLLLAATANP